MKTFDIWTEGYQANTDSARASCLVKNVEGKDFKDACVNYAKIDEEFARYFDESRMTYWGCQLFDNESNARKNFG